MTTAQLSISKAIETAIGSNRVLAELEAKRNRALMSGNVRKLAACEIAIAQWVAL
jgi:hypothetical protein